jgi:nitrite reductase/ring-hydroxylating ferredoxin subunit
MSDNGWHRIDPADVPAEDRVRSAIVASRSVALSWCGALGALENRCPHQGRPLGEGSIEKGWLRWPWHGYDYDPVTGLPPEGFADGVVTCPVQERADGVYVQLPELPPPARTVADMVVETLVAWGVRHVFGMVGHSNLGFAEALRAAEARGELTYVGEGDVAQEHVEAIGGSGTGARPPGSPCRRRARLRSRSRSRPRYPRTPAPCGCRRPRSAHGSAGRPPRRARRVGCGEACIADAVGNVRGWGAVV